MARPESVIGLDMGSSLIKMVEARAAKGAGIELLALGIRPTPPEVIQNGVIVEPEALGTALRQLLAQYGIKTRAVVSSVSGQSSLVVRPIQVPRMTRAELADTMKWEVERHIPFDASEVIMDYQPLQDPETLPPEAQTMEVLLAVAQEDMIKAHLRTLEMAGLDPVAIDVEPLAACRSLVDINSDRGAYDQVVALVNIGATSTEVSVVRNGMLSLTRPIPIAGDILTRSIVEGLNTTQEEAERLKREHGRVLLEGAAPPTPPPRPAPEITRPEAEPEEGPTAVLDLGAGAGPPSPRPSAIFDLEEEEERAPAPAPAAPPTPEAEALSRRLYQAMLPSLGDMVLEIRRSLEYYHSRYPADRVERVVLYGGTAKLENLCQFMSNELGLPVELADPLRRLSLQAQPYSQDYLREVACVLPIPVGLAIRDMIG